MTFITKFVDLSAYDYQNGFSLEIDGNFTIVYVLQTTDIFDGLIILSDVSSKWKFLHSSVLLHRIFCDYDLSDALKKNI